LQQLVHDGKISARTKWKHIYPSFCNDDRYLGMLGNPGSNPIELFWDVVDKLDQALDAKLATVQEVIQRYNAGNRDDEMVIDGVVTNPFVVGPDTTEKEFIAIVKGELDDATKKMSGEDLREVFQNVSRFS
jgi:pre-mRNA-processing factor 40